MPVLYKLGELFVTCRSSHQPFQKHNTTRDTSTHTPSCDMVSTCLQLVKQAGVCTLQAVLQAGNGRQVSCQGIFWVELLSQAQKVGSSVQLPAHLLHCLCPLCQPTTHLHPTPTACCVLSVATLQQSPVIEGYRQMALAYGSIEGA